MFTQVRLVRYTHTVGVAGGDEYLPENQMIIYWSVVSQLHAKPSTPHEKSVCEKVAVKTVTLNDGRYKVELSF